MFYYLIRIFVLFASICCFFISCEVSAYLPFPEQEPFVWTTAIYNVRSDSFFKIRVDSFKKINENFTYEDLLYNIEIKFSWSTGKVENFQRKAFPYNDYDLVTRNAYFYSTKVTRLLPTNQTYEIKLQQGNKLPMLARNILRDTPVVNIIGKREDRKENIILYSFNIKLLNSNKTCYYVIYPSEDPYANHSIYPDEEDNTPINSYIGFPCNYRKGAWLVAVTPNSTGEQSFQLPFSPTMSGGLEVAEVSYAFYVIYKNTLENKLEKVFEPYSPLLSNFTEGKGLFELLNPSRLNL